MDRRMWAGRTAAVAALLAAALVLSSPASAGQAPVTAGEGAGIIGFTGPADLPIALTVAGNYYLVVASDSGISSAAVLYNGTTVLGQVNSTASEADLVPLPAGNLTFRVAGSGRAALALDFTNGSLTTFAAGGSVVAFASPVGTGIVVSVHLGDASAVSLQVYDASLHLAGNETFTSDGTASVTFGGSQPFAVLVAASTTTRAGYFGLSWTPPPGPAPLDPFVLFAVGFVAAILLAAAVLFLLERRRRRR